MAIARRELLRASAAASALAGLGLPVDGEVFAVGVEGDPRLCMASAVRGLRGEAREGGGGPTVVVAGVVIETVPGAAPRVAARLLAERGLELHGGDGDRRLAAVFTGDACALEALAERLLREHVEVTGVIPTYVADEPDDPAAPGDGPAGEGGGELR